MTDSQPMNQQINRTGIFIDLCIYLAVMFLIREVYFEQFNFIANGLFWSFTTLIVATWRLRARGVKWKDLGLTKPDKLLKTFLVSGAILIVTFVVLIVFNVALDVFNISIGEDHSDANAASKFGDLKNNWPLFFTIIPLIWLESALEEILDRGFLMNWLEKLFSNASFATVFAVVVQAAIFGFRHSYDLSERSITVGLIGLVMGTAYVLSGRNLWPLIIAHALLNTISMMDRV